jgi:hypothetical protein
MGKCKYIDYLKEAAVREPGLYGHSIDSKGRPTNFLIAAPRLLLRSNSYHPKALEFEQTLFQKQYKRREYQRIWIKNYRAKHSKPILSS